MLFVFVYRKLIPNIDVNKDKKISRQELTDWIETHMKKHLMTTTEKRMKEMDKNGDGKVTHKEYETAEYANVQADEKGTKTFSRADLPSFTHLA